MGILLLSGTVLAQNPVELGQVNWLRDMEAAKAQSEKSGKPIFILFQEVPGCMTCQRFGSQVMSDKRIVESIESLFIPLCIYNNTGGKDRETLSSYNEPTWNNPVMRIVSEDGNTIDRLAGQYSVEAVSKFLIEGLISTGREVPVFLALYSDAIEAESAGIKYVFVATPCFWSGEIAMSDLDGVVSTEAGWMNGREVVKVGYNSKRTNYQHVLNHAVSKGCLSKVYTENQTEMKIAIDVVGTEKASSVGKYSQDRDTKYYLQKSKFKGLDLEEIQKVKINACLTENRDCTVYLSPQQKQALLQP